MPPIPSQPPIPGTPREVDALLTLAQYGNTMFQVQRFEMSLAIQVLVSDPKFGKPTKVTDAVLQKTISKQIHVFQRASARELKNLLTDSLDAVLLERVSHAIEWRDVLAHRYLRERVRRDDHRAFKAGTYGELIKLATMFGTVGEEVAAVWKRRLAQPGSSGDEPREPRPGVARAWERAARAILYGSSWSEDEDDDLARAVRELPRLLSGMPARTDPS